MCGSVLSVDFLAPGLTSSLGRIPKKKREASQLQSASVTNVQSAPAPVTPAAKVETPNQTRKINFETYISRKNAQNLQQNCQKQDQVVEKCTTGTTVKDLSEAFISSVPEQEANLNQNPSEIQSPPHDGGCGSGIGDVTNSASHIPSEPVNAEHHSSTVCTAKHRSHLSQLHATCKDATPAQLGLDKFDRLLFQGTQIDIGEKPEEVKLTVKVTVRQPPVMVESEESEDEVLQKAVYSVINRWACARCIWRPVAFFSSVWPPSQLPVCSHCGLLL